MEWKPLPVGIDDFEKIVTGDYFYVDKTLLLGTVGDKRRSKPFYTSPPFWENFDMSMLRYFFEENPERLHGYSGLEYYGRGENIWIIWEISVIMIS